MIGDYERPKVRLPGGGGAPEIATQAREVFVMLRQSPRTFVERLDFMTSVGDARLGRRDRPRDPRAGADGELTLTRRIPASPSTRRGRRPDGAARRPDLGETAAPTDDELLALRGPRDERRG